MFVQARNNHNSSSDIDKPIPRIAGVDYFCGAGGLTCGLQQSGIEIVAGIDNDANCAFAYETNNSSIFINKKIEDISILHYYGQYGNCYVVQIIDAYADFPAVESECVVAGIVVKYSGPHIIVWERTDFEY